MPEITQHPHGTFCWVELATTDQSGAKDFYTKLFGWSVNDVPIGENEFYSMLQLEGKDVGALCTMREEQEEQGIPSNWLCYVSVTNVDEVTRKAKELGARIQADPFDVFDAGRMAVIEDPTGAIVALWQPKSHIGSRLVQEFGTMCWHELQTNDVDGARKFYTSLLGWSTKADNTAYTEFTQNQNSFAGMMKIEPEWGEVPPHWGVYFLVQHCDETMARAKSLGGQALVPPTDIPNVGRFSTLVDPQGAPFSIIQLNQTSV